MGKIGRNDPCPCGSGKKYKKCCMDKDEQNFARPRASNQGRGHWWFEKVNEMSTADIIDKLASLGIHHDEKAFLKDVEECYSAEQIANKWFKIFRVVAAGRDLDFPLFAAWVLWERMAPEYLLSMEQMSDWVDKGYGYSVDNNPESACDVWLEVWEALKYRIKPEFKDLDFLEQQYSGSFFISNVCQDLEEELHNAGFKDKKYFEKRIDYCRDFCNYFPDEDELIIHNMKRAIAESYLCLKNISAAEHEFQEIIADYPDNPWSYIAFGDMYWFYQDIIGDFNKAKVLYEKALAVAKEKADISVIRDRLEDLDAEMKRVTV